MLSRYILGNRVDSLTMDEAVDKIAEFIKEGKPHHIVTMNAEIAYQAYNNPQLQAVINRADLVTADGSGIVWAAKKLGKPVKERVTGIDLLKALANEGSKRGWRFYLYGAAPGVAAKAAKRLEQDYVGIKVVGTKNGYISEREMPALIKDIKGVKPDILLVGLGAPRQEYWIARHLEEVQVPVMIGVGGSFDVLAGVVPRAPEWIQRLNLEWLYRIVKFKRFKRALALPKFMLAVLKEARQEEQEKGS
ncbi:MAG: N-acetylglucosaminyldiphosphoundecaprenol N-acetyl-beta-D-mannosaminyltransferase [Clostridia bacterium]|nr:N-acetylglucosaminyldiphosphoundecaprenol N-acetyl-beta-D-mannosaminyltransferase [Clostridia bacterium]